MTDIVERLRTQEVDLFRLQDEAADTIESLRALCKQMGEALEKADGVIYEEYSGTNLPELDICTEAIAAYKEKV
jgi:hypothetical protein